MLNENAAVCPKCGSDSVEAYSTLHHYLCSYVGPQYDFGIIDGVYKCPKCEMNLEREYEDWEVVGYCCKCDKCGAEFIDESFLSQ